MTHTLIATNTLDACIGICAPPPTHTHRQLAYSSTQHNTQHKMSRVEGGGWGANTNTTETPPNCRAITPTPSILRCRDWGYLACCVALEVRGGIPFLFVGVFLLLCIIFHN